MIHGVLYGFIPSGKCECMCVCSFYLLRFKVDVYDTCRYMCHTWRAYGLVRLVTIAQVHA